MKTSVYRINDKDVKIFIPDHHKKIAVAVSGGTDSSLTLYLVCLYLIEHNKLDVEIVLRHCIETYRAPFSYQNSAKIIFDKFQKYFPQLKFTQNVFTIDEEPHPILGTQPKYQIRSYKIEKMDENRLQLIKEGVQTFFGGVTSNPSKEIQQEMNMVSGASWREQDVVDPNNQFRAVNKTGRTYDYDTCEVFLSKPLMLVDKKTVASFYNKYEFLKKQIYPLTFSCVNRHPEVTRNWSLPCKTCWWCKEKLWAFGTYDGGILE
jgi:7-cyano-7-deazaguanine synthase in queuosine biosynthesis